MRPAVLDIDSGDVPSVRSDDSAKLLNLHQDAQARPDADATVEPPLTRLRTVGYGIGHHLNDMCAACWFTYLLLCAPLETLTITRGPC